ncbi:hypothetical protein ACOSP7_014679 [Xanthoceras sorbifolium]
MNALLVARFSIEEVRAALMQMSPQKSPSPDGLFTAFFQRYWNVVGTKVVRAIMAILNEGAKMDSLGEDLVVLIPKVKIPVKTREFRPIILCNVIYKLIAKVIANRLKLVLGDIISPNQSAFVFGCLIIDNVVVSFEWFEGLSCSQTGYEQSL